MGGSQFREVARRVRKASTTSTFNEFAIAYVLNPLKLQLRANNGHWLPRGERSESPARFDPPVPGTATIADSGFCEFAECKA
jgi:hypothetical protein